MKTFLLSLFLLGVFCGGAFAAEPVELFRTPVEGGLWSTNVHVGDEVVMRLPANPTTGYTWTLGTLPKGIEFVSEEYHTRRLSLRVPAGAGGTMLMLFRAVEKGTWFFPIIYSRTWETQIPPQNYVVVHIQVE